ncbi:MAG: hypothetical protein V7L06_30085 [Nostoc sp.]
MNILKNLTDAIASKSSNSDEKTSLTLNTSRLKVKGEGAKGKKKPLTLPL